MGGCGQAMKAIQQEFESKLDAIEGVLESSLQEDQLDKIISRVESSFDMALYRLQAKHEHDYADLKKLLLQSMDTAKGQQQMPNDWQNRSSTSDGLKSKAVPDGFDAMQKSLVVNFSNMISKLLPEQRRSRLRDLRNNLSGQPPGKMRDKQQAVLDHVESLLSE